jgi:hypothetical protein
VRHQKEPVKNSYFMGVILISEDKTIREVGDIWFTANVKGHTGELKPQTGELKEYYMPEPAARDPHYKSDGEDDRRPGFKLLKTLFLEGHHAP